MESSQKALKPEFIKLNTEQRLYQMDRPIIAITGGIATGKSTFSELLSQKIHQSVICADRLVKKIYGTSEAKKFLMDEFPTVIKSGEINFKQLRENVFKDQSAKSKVETFIYSKLQKAFLDQANSIKSEFIIYDVPLLFEKKLETQVDLSILVYCPRQTQIERVIKRDGISRDLAEKILNEQMPIEEKVKKADIVIKNKGQLNELALEVDLLVNKVFD